MPGFDCYAGYSRKNQDVWLGHIRSLYVRLNPFSSGYVRLDQVRPG